MLNSLDKLVECASFGSRKSAGKVFAAVTALLVTAGAAHAATTDTIEVLSYTVTYHSTSGPSAAISNNLGTGTSHEFNLTVGNATSTPTAFFTAAPSGCTGSCLATLINSTAFGTVSVSMNFKDVTTGATGSFSNVIGDYQAKYSGAHLACANDAGSAGGGQTDCIDWEGTTALSGYSVTEAVTLGALVLDVTLYNQEDWNITPYISFQLTDPHATPLPGALPLFVSGSGLLGLIGLRRKKQMAKKAAAV